MHVFYKKNDNSSRASNIKVTQNLYVSVWKISIFLPECNPKRINSISCSVFKKIVFKVNVPEYKPGRVIYLY